MMSKLELKIMVRNKLVNRTIKNEKNDSTSKSRVAIWTWIFFSVIEAKRKHNVLSHLKSARVLGFFTHKTHPIAALLIVPISFCSRIFNQNKFKKQNNACKITARFHFHTLFSAIRVIWFSFLGFNRSYIQVCRLFFKIN